MDLEEIRTFIEVANYCSFSKAADVLHVVQSTVSNRMRSLEEYTGEQLVIRDKSGIRLTPAGNTFLNYAKQIQKLGETVLKELHMVSAYEDFFNVACAQWLFSYMLEPLLTKYIGQYPRIATNLTIAHSKEIVSLLQNRMCDLALIPYKINNTNLHSIPFYKTRILFVGSANKFAGLREGISKEELENIPLIYSDIWENFLSSVSENLLSESKTFQVHCNMLDSAKSFCAAGIGCCFLPETMVQNELKKGTMIHIPIHGLAVKHIQTYLVYNIKRADSIALKSWFHICSSKKTE